MQGRPQDALPEIEQLPQWDRGFPYALTYRALGRQKESDLALKEYIAKYREGSAYQIAEVYAFQDLSDKAFEWLERTRRCLSKKTYLGSAGIWLLEPGHTAGCL